MSSIPAVVLILAVFIGMLVLTRIKVPLGVALALGGISLAVLTRMPAGAIAKNFFVALAGADMWLLMVVIVLVTEIARFMTREGNAQRVVNVFSRWGGRHGRAWGLMGAPAIIGLLPMPGGALFSAPLVQQATSSFGAETESSPAPEWKAALNHWFRHIWEFWWPLYPGVIFAMTIFDVEPLRFMAAMVLFTPVAALAGYVSLVRPHLAQYGAPAPQAATGSGSRDLMLLLPLLVVVIAALFLPMALAWAFPGIDSRVNKLLAMLIGLVLGLAISRHLERDRPAPMNIKTLLDGKTCGILLTIAGIFVFQHMLKETGLVKTACVEMRDWGFPAAVAVAALPALAGLVTGIAAAFAGVSLPLVVELLATPGTDLYPVSTMILAYVSGYVGMMMSPVHLCVIVTSDYFSASLRKVLLKLVPSVTVVMSLAIVMFTVLRALKL